ncbi:hypothetical protein HXZ94_14735 [Empedobacter falsenii]|uniref:hypothetical protein n=1 Tax=Empedobacter falsenii TaxID=343874 RepID=UPI0025790190|nr:hypothetical protein [Empedobacter falsenii]MDM1299750.1 hypothetical protein [Empedobacter falsenii]MDM1319543.1 hypothetical protein [Empedobacter falsenii]
MKVTIINFDELFVSGVIQDFKLLQIETYLYYLNPQDLNFEYWYEKYKALLFDKLIFNIRRNTIYNIDEICCNRYFNNGYFSLNHLKLKQMQVNHLHSVSNNSNIKFEQVKSYIVLELMLDSLLINLNTN